MGGLIALLSIFTCILIARRRGVGGAAAVLVVRVIMLGVLGALVYRIFWNFNAEELDVEGDPRKHRIVVLQDQSHSMDFASGKNTRMQEADAVLKTLKRLAADHPKEPIIERMYFGGNVVTEDRKDELRRDSTQTSSALRRVFSLLQLDGLVVVSDGAATDGNPPQYLLDWAGNRGLHVRTVATGTAGGGGLDFVAVETKCDQTNPKVVRAVVSCLGPYDGELQVQFHIDGKLKEQKTVAAEEGQEVSFTVTEEQEGWHEYAIRVVADAREVTARNNVQLGIFQVVAPRRILFVYDSPKLENRYLVNFLRSLHDDNRLQIASVADPDLTDIQPQDYLLTIIGDVKPDRLPAALAGHIKKGNLTTLLLSGRNLKYWRADQFPGFPVHKFIATRNLYVAKAPAAKVAVSSKNSHPAFRRLKLDSLRLNVIDRISMTRDAVPVFSAISGSREYPLLLSNSLQRPRSLVLLSDTTWKWGLHPNPRVRSDYKAFWRVLMNWLVGDQGEAFELDIEFSPGSEDDDTTRVLVRHPNAETTRTMKKVSLQVRQGADSKQMSMKLDADAWVKNLANPKERPAIVWYRANGSIGTRNLQSIERPYLLPAASQELFDTRARPETLQALVANKDEHFAVAGKEEAMLRRLMDAFDTPGRSVQVRQRNSTQELIFAAIIVLLVGLEWLIERTLKARA